MMKSTIVLLFIFASLFMLIYCQVSTSLNNLNNWLPTFLRGTNAGTMYGFKKSKDGTMDHARTLVNLPEFSAVKGSINWWLWHNDQCAYCLTLMPNWNDLIYQTWNSDAKQILRKLKAMEARLALAWPTFCDRSYDRCYMTPNGYLSDKLCTRAYCFFNPGEPCSMRGSPARCKSLQWLKDNSIGCPLPCRSLKKRDAVLNLIKRRTSTVAATDSRSVHVRALERLGRNSEEVAKKAGTLQLSGMKGKRGYCGYSVSCGNCPTSELSGGCMDQSPVTGEWLCCDCFVHPTDLGQWKRQDTMELAN